MMVTPSAFWRAQLAARRPAAGLDQGASRRSRRTRSFPARVSARGADRCAACRGWRRDGERRSRRCEIDIGLTPKVGGKGRSDTSGFRDGAMRAESQPHHRDTPPEDVYVVEAGLLARGSMLLSGLPETLRASVTLLDSGSPLTVAGQLRLWLTPHRLPSWLRENASRKNHDGSSLSAMCM